MPWQKLANILLYINIAGTAVLVLRLFAAGLVRRFRWFSGFLMYALIRVAIASIVKFSPSGYFVYYVATEAVLWIFYAMILSELYDSVFDGLPGIRTFSTQAMLVALTLSITAAVAISWPAITAASTAERYTEALLGFYAVERGVLFGLAVLIILTAVFLIWFPVPLARNVVFHSFLFTTYFLSKAMTLLFRGSVASKSTPQVNVILLAIAAASLIGWIVLLRRSGETKPVVMGHSWNRAQEDRLIRQLREVNRVLVGTSRD